MTGERVLAANLTPGDLIHVEHVHGVPGTKCLCGHWETDAVVIARETICGHVVVQWQETPALLGGRRSISGANAYGPEDEAIRIGHLAVAA